MPLFTPHKPLPLLLIGATLLLGGCSKDNAESRAAEAQKAAAAVMAPALPPLPKIDYWKPVASHLAGRYNSDCKRTPDAAPSPLTLAIGTDGRAIIDGRTIDLIDSETTVLTHSPVIDADDALEMNSTDSKGTLALRSGDQGQGSRVSVKHNGRQLECAQSPDTIGLTNQSLHTLYAHVLGLPRNKLTCVDFAPNIGSGDLRYAYKDGVLQLNDTVYELAKFEETVTLHDGFSSFTYSILGDDGGKMALTLDSAGQILEINSSVGVDDDPLLSCYRS